MISFPYRKVYIWERVKNRKNSKEHEEQHNIDHQQDQTLDNMY